MNLASALQLDAIWLQLQNHDIVPLNPSLAECTFELDMAIRRGARAYPDLKRIDFYDIELRNGWAYIHVRREARTVYIVASSSSASFISFCTRDDSENESRKE